MLTIRLDIIQDRSPVRSGRKAVRAPRNNDASGKSLDIPFPGTRQCLVKIIHIEDLIAFWRGVDAKVAEMRISTVLYLESGDRSCSQVLCHNDRRAAQKGKRRGGHPCIAQRHKMW